MLGFEIVGVGVKIEEIQIQTAVDVLQIGFGNNLTCRQTRFHIGPGVLIHLVDFHGFGKGRNKAAGNGLQLFVIDILNVIF